MILRMSVMGIEGGVYGTKGVGCGAWGLRVGCMELRVCGMGIEGGVHGIKCVGHGIEGVGHGY